MTEGREGAQQRRRRAGQLRRLVPGWALAACAVAGAQDSRALIQTVISNETDANQHRGYYTYSAEEKSDRTGGHVWQERVVETAWGKVKYLVLEDGKPLSTERVAAERARLADEAAHPEEFKRMEGSRSDDEHARQMLQLLPRAFLFDPPKREGDYLRVTYRPNPDYQPVGLEEKVLHGMVGSVLVDSRANRVREIEGRMPEDVTVGWGLLATVKAGSNFSTLREHLEGSDWKTETLHTDINGKAMFLKTIAREQESRRWGYQRVADNLTVGDAVKMLEQ